MFRVRDAGWSDGVIRSGYPCGWGNSEGRTPYPNDPDAHFLYLNTKSRCWWYVYFLGGDRGSHAWIHALRDPRRAEFLLEPYSSLSLSVGCLRGGGHSWMISCPPTIPSYCMCYPTDPYPRQPLPPIPFWLKRMIASDEPSAFDYSYWFLLVSFRLSSRGTLVGGGIRRGALRTLTIPMRIFSISTPSLDAIGTYIS